MPTADPPLRAISRYVNRSLTPIHASLTAETIDPERIPKTITQASSENMKALAITMSVLLALVAGLFAAAYLLSLPPFYWADYHRSRDGLSAVPGLQIMDDWKHEDITLENWGFTVRVSDSEPVGIDFDRGADCMLPFKRLDGVTVYTRTGGYKEVSLTARQLRDHGIDATNLGSVLQDLRKLLEIATPEPITRDWYPSEGVWVLIQRDLVGYQEGSQVGF